MVFDAPFLKRLEALRLAVRRVLGGPREGERPGARRGGSSTFHSYRAYAQGDDFRSIDWSLYARLNALFVRERTREEALAIHLLLDTSASMSFGTPSKVDLARRLAAALGYLVTGEGGDAILWSGAKSRVFRGPGSAPALLDAVATEGGNPLEALPRIEGRGVIVIASDFWDDGLEPPMSTLAETGHQLTLLHLLAREELDPPIHGRVRIADAEDGRAVTRFVAEEERARYQSLLEEHVQRWRAWAMKREASYVRCASDTPFDEVCLLYLRGEGVLE